MSDFMLKVKTQTIDETSQLLLVVLRTFEIDNDAEGEAIFMLL